MDKTFANHHRNANEMHGMSRPWHELCTLLWYMQLKMMYMSHPWPPFVPTHLHACTLSPTTLTPCFITPICFLQPRKLHPHLLTKELWNSPPGPALLHGPSITRNWSPRIYPHRWFTLVTMMSTTCPMILMFSYFMQLWRQGWFKIRALPSLQSFSLAIWQHQCTETPDCIVKKLLTMLAPQAEGRHCSSLQSCCITKSN